MLQLVGKPRRPQSPGDVSVADERVSGDEVAVLQCVRRRVEATDKGLQVCRRQTAEVLGVGRASVSVLVGFGEGLVQVPWATRWARAAAPAAYQRPRR